MSQSLSRLLASFQHQSQEFLEALRTFSGNSALNQQAEEQTERFRDEWESIVQNGGFTLPTIAFVGPFNAGKSFLVRALIDHPEVDHYLSVGTADQQATRRFIWIGNETPSRTLDPELEQHWKLSREDMADLGVSEGYLLLDTPGSGDHHQQNQQLAELALSNSQLKVLVIPQSKSREASYLQYIHKGDGSVILPVINRCRFGENPEQEKQELQENILKRLHQHAPNSDILAPLFIPDLDFKDTDSTFGPQQIRSELAHALQQALADPQRLRLSLRTQLQASYQRYLHTLRNTLSPLLTSGLTESLHELKQQEQHLPAQILHLLQDNPQQIRLVIKRQLRADLLERVPLWAFPFRTFTGILSFTTGLWDRLTLSAMGSLPSLVTTGYQTVKNQREETRATDFLHHQLKQRMTSRVRESLRPLLARFRDQVQQMTRHQISDTTSSNQEIDFDIHGIDPLADQWLQDIQATTYKHRWRWGFGLFPLLATLVFLFMIGAPLLHVYGQYLPAALQSFQWEHPQIAQLHYPVLSFGFWGSTLLLSAIPVFLLSMLAVCFALRNKRIQRIEKELRQRFQNLLNHPHLNFDIQLKDSQISAARKVFTIFHQEESSQEIRSGD